MGMNDVPRCQHVKVNGVQCGSPALRRRRFCYFHENYRQTQARLMADQSEVRISNFPLLEDANSIQVAVMHVIHLLVSGRMDTKVAGLTLYALQTASANMKRVSFEVGKATDVVIDQDTLDLTCINGPQWFDRDFQEIGKKTTQETTNQEKREALPDAKPATKAEEFRLAEDLRIAERAKLRKKPDPIKDTPDLDDSLAGILLRRLGIIPGNGTTEDEVEEAREEAREHARENAREDQPATEMLGAE
jgi:hypothetical protein